MKKYAEVEDEEDVVVDEAEVEVDGCSRQGVAGPNGIPGPQRLACVSSATVTCRADAEPMMSTTLPAAPNERE